MTAHRQKPTITPEIVKRFAAYYARNPAWGVIHCSFDDGNWKLRARVDESTDDEGRWIASIHDALTESQKRRLCKAAEGLEPKPW